MTEERPTNTNIADLLKKEGYTIIKLHDDWTIIRQGSQIVAHILNQGTEVDLEYKTRPIDVQQITAALDLRDVLNRKTIPYREQDRLQALYGLTDDIAPCHTSAEHVVAELLRRADLAERLMQQKK